MKFLFPWTGLGVNGIASTHIISFYIPLMLRSKKYDLWYALIRASLITQGNNAVLVKYRNSYVFNQLYYV